MSPYDYIAGKELVISIRVVKDYVVSSVAISFPPGDWDSQINWNNHYKNMPM